MAPEASSWRWPGCPFDSPSGVTSIRSACAATTEPPTVDAVTARIIGDELYRG